MDENSHNMIDTTDCLEAVSAFKSMKNFFFLLILLCLLILQGLFWLNSFGWIEKEACVNCPGQKTTAFVLPLRGGLIPLAAPAAEDSFSEQEDTDSQPIPAGQIEEEPAVQIPENSIAAQAEKVTEEISGKAEPAEVSSKETESAPPTQTASEPGLDLAKFKMKDRHAAALIAILNFILLISAVMYSLILLMTLKVSLAARLGGINHISRAFFISLFAMVLLFPWQQVLPGVLVGAVYLPNELLVCGPACQNDSGVCLVLMYLRFTGLWFLTLWFYLWAQNRSGKWSRTTLRRLGVLR